MTSCEFNSFLLNQVSQHARASSPHVIIHLGLEAIKHSASVKSMGREVCLR